MKKILVLIVFYCMSCQNHKQELQKKSSLDINGNWEYLGFGKGVHIADSLVKNYHLSTVGNTPYEDNIIFSKYYDIDMISNDTMLLKDGVKTFKLYRSNKDFEKNNYRDLAKDPEYNFETLWNTFNEQYVYFNERNINWDSIYNVYRPQVKSNTTDLELYLVFEKMLNSIGDGHVSIEIPEDIEDDYISYTNNSDKVINAIPKGLDRKIKDKIINMYLNNPRFYNKGDFKWGMINNDVAYLQTQNMIGWANYNINDSLSTKKFWKEWWNNLNRADNHHNDVAKGTRFIMDSIVQTIREAKSCILDLRFNGGGFDDVSIEILNHFAKTQIDICTKKVRLYNGFTEKQKMTLIPSKNTFKGHLYILTSHETASAAELVVLGGLAMDNVTIIGSTTEGVFSDILHKQLPNGWNYGLSNMVYESMQGISYEYTGIKPHYDLQYPKASGAFYKYLLEDLNDGDDAIEMILKNKNLN